MARFLCLVQSTPPSSLTLGLPRSGCQRAMPGVTGWPSQPRPPQPARQWSSKLPATGFPTGLTSSRFPPPPARRPAFTSTFVGVSYCGKRQNWKAQLRVFGKVKHLGYFDSEEEAARMFDFIAAPLGKSVNFPGPGQAQAVGGRRGGGSGGAEGSGEDGPGEADGSGVGAKYIGVTFLKRQKRWRAQFRDGRVVRCLGSGYASAEAAARAYDEVAGPLGRKLNFQPAAEGAAAATSVAAAEAATGLPAEAEIAVATAGLSSSAAAAPPRVAGVVKASGAGVLPSRSWQVWVQPSTAAPAGGGAPTDGLAAPTGGTPPPSPPLKLLGDFASEEEAASA